MGTLPAIIEVVVPVSGAGEAAAILRRNAPELAHQVVTVLRSIHAERLGGVPEALTLWPGVSDAGLGGRGPGKGKNEQGPNKNPRKEGEAEPLLFSVRVPRTVLLASGGEDFLVAQIASMLEEAARRRDRRATNRNNQTEAS